MGTFLSLERVGTTTITLQVTDSKEKPVGRFHDITGESRYVVFLNNPPPEYPTITKDLDKKTAPPQSGSSGNSATPLGPISIGVIVVDERNTARFSQDQDAPALEGPILKALIELISQVESNTGVQHVEVSYPRTS